MTGRKRRTDKDLREGDVNFCKGHFTPSQIALFLLLIGGVTWTGCRGESPSADSLAERSTRTRTTALAEIPPASHSRLSDGQAEGAGASASQRRKEWWAWRGPNGTGVAPDSDPPVEWSEEKNVTWKVEIPGRGHSTPIVVGDQIILTSSIPVGEPLDPPIRDNAPGSHDNIAVDFEQQFVVLALQRENGELAWQTTVRTAIPREGGHHTASLASPSPVSDGSVIIASFGSQGVYALEMDGSLRWEIDLGQMQSKHGHGEGITPALYGDTVVLAWDHEGQSQILAVDKTTGKTIWNKERDEVTSWSSPIIVDDVEPPQVIVSGTDRVRGYALDTGEVVWECGGLSANIVASPVAADGVVYVGSSYEKRAFLAIRYRDAKGDVTRKENLLWSRSAGTPYVPSPLLYDDGLYFLRHYQGIMTRVTATTGAESPGTFRLDGLRDIYASPVGAGERVYVTDLEGVTLVFSQGELPRLLAINRLDDQFSASAAIAGNELYLRGRKHLYRIEEKTAP